MTWWRGANCTPNIEVTESNDSCSNGSASASPCAHSISSPVASARTCATSSSSETRSRPTTRAPCYAACRATLPLPVATSRTRAPGRTCAAVIASRTGSSAMWRATAGSSQAAQVVRCASLTRHGGHGGSFGGGVQLVGLRWPRCVSSWTRRFRAAAGEWVVWLLLRSASRQAESRRVVCRGSYACAVPATQFGNGRGRQRRQPGAAAASAGVGTSWRWIRLLVDAERGVRRASFIRM